MRFRKKPLEVEAVKIPNKGEETSPARNSELAQFVIDNPMAFSGFMILDDGWSVITVDRNRVTVPWGAYCVLDMKGFPYPCDAEIFEASHEPLDGGSFDG